MKKRLINLSIVALCTLLAILVGCASAVENAAAEAGGSLRITFDYSRARTMASNQFAVWIEDSAGTLVKTLYVSRFTADGGYASRPESLPSWAEAAVPASMGGAELDAVSSATPLSGEIVFLWDCKYADGEPVPNGEYTFHVEGTLYWSSSVKHSGSIHVGGPIQSVEASAEYTEAPEVNADMLLNVRGVYTPALFNQNDLGAMSPETALAYMKEAEDLVVVDVAATRWYEQSHFTDALNIPIEELDSAAEDALYMALPVGKPVLLHCRLGMIVPGAYRRVKELRPDIPEIAYIDGAPLFDEYNEWAAEQH